MLAVTLIGCGGGGGTPATDSGGGDTGRADADPADTGGADTGGADRDAGPEDASADSGPDADSGPSGAACMNAADLGICASCTATGCTNECPNDRGAAGAVANTCGFGCAEDPDAVACTKACVVDAAGLSSGCADCHVTATLCMIASCLPQCLAPSSDACAECKETAGCSAAFLACAGFESVCDDLADNNGNGDTDCADISCVDEIVCI